MSEFGAKKRRLDSWKVKEWQRALENVTAWLEKVENSLGIDPEQPPTQEQLQSLWEGMTQGELQVLTEVSLLALALGTVPHLLVPLPLEGLLGTA